MILLLFIWICFVYVWNESNKEFQLQLPHSFSTCSKQQRNKNGGKATFKLEEKKISNEPIPFWQLSVCCSLKWIFTKFPIGCVSFRFRQRRRPRLPKLDDWLIICCFTRSKIAVTRALIWLLFLFPFAFRARSNLLRLNCQIGCAREIRSVVWNSKWLDYDCETTTTKAAVAAGTAWEKKIIKRVEKKE